MAAEPELSPRLERFELRGDQVTLTWSAEVKLHAGSNQVRLSGLQPGAVIRRAHVPGGTLVGTRTTGRSSRPGEALDPKLWGRRTALERLIGLLESLEPPPALEAFHPVDAWHAAEALLELRERSSQELESLVSPPSSPDEGRCTMELRVRAPAPTTSRLELTTDAGQGQWSLEGELDLVRDVASPPCLNLRARVEHSTGREADGVRVVLASEAPSPRAVGSRRPWIVRSEAGYDERSASLHAERPTSNARSFTRDPATVGVEPRHLRIADDVRVAPDVFLVDLGFIECGLEQRYRLRPVLGPQAYTSWTLRPNAPVPRCSASIRVDGELRRRETLPAGGPDSPWALELGPEPRLSARRSVRTHLRSGSLLQRGDVHETVIQIEIDSTLAAEAVVELEDQIPVSTDPRVQVNFHPSPTQVLDGPTGQVSQTLAVAPGRTTHVELRYSIEAPHDYRLVQALGPLT